MEKQEYLRSLIQKGKADYLELKQLLKEGFLTLEDLMELAKMDVIGAFDVICENLRPQLTKIALRNLRDSYLAEDAVQEALIRAYTKKQLFNPAVKKKSLAGWFIMILFRKTYEMRTKGKVKISAFREQDFSALGVDVDRLFKNLLKQGYIDKKGIIQTKFKALKDHSELTLDPIYKDKKERVYAILRKALNSEEYIATETPMSDKLEDIFSGQSKTPEDKKKRFKIMALEECISGLNEEEKLTIDLHFLGELITEEILPIFRQEFKKGSLGTVNARLHKGLEKLKECVEGKLKNFEKFI